jgi:prepilin-type N-terminal cleavage/methylation domain-containing protein/prepilin-type processing-associated H-X9-DG protein
MRAHQAKPCTSRTPRGGFTLVEMLVVIGIIGIVVSMVVPAIGTVQAEAHSTQCLSNLRQIHTAIQSHRAVNNDLLPLAAMLQGDAVNPDFIRLAERLDPIISKASEVWLCPADQTQDSQEIGTSYYYSAGGWMLFEVASIAEPRRVARIITQRYDSGFLRTFPVSADSNIYHEYGSRYPANAVFIDGHARVMKDADLLFTPDNSNQIPDPPE